MRRGGFNSVACIRAIISLRGVEQWKAGGLERDRHRTLPGTLIITQLLSGLLSCSLFFCLPCSFTLFLPFSLSLSLSLSLPLHSPLQNKYRSLSLRLVGTEAPWGHKPQQVFMPTQWWGWWRINPHSHVSCHLSLIFNKIIKDITYELLARVWWKLFRTMHKKWRTSAQSTCSSEVYSDLRLLTKTEG